MTVRDSLKRLIHLVKTAGLPSETLHVIETKLSSLEDQIVALENENSKLREESEKLKIQVKCLQPQSEEVSKDTIGVLKLFFERARDISAEDISKAFKWRQSVADYHVEVLLKKRFIRESTIGMQTAFGSSAMRYGLTTLGRRYIIQYSPD
jgi:predicted nuclease with TOPRIM domain